MFLGTHDKLSGLGLPSISINLKKSASLRLYQFRVIEILIANKFSIGSDSDVDIFSPFITFGTNLSTDKGAGPTGFEPAT